MRCSARLQPCRVVVSRRPSGASARRAGAARVDVRATVLALFLLFQVGAKAQEYVGADACSSCHSEQFAAQGLTNHARALRPAGEHPLTAEFASASARDGSWSYVFSRSGDGPLTVTLRSEEAIRELVVDWAFGSGYQASTFVSRLNEDDYLEHHLSFYTEKNQLGLTPGHQTLPVETPDEALGLRYRTFSPQTEILRCFRCHTTGPLGLSDEFAIEPSELGVRCEACHGPGAEHIAKIGAGEVAAAKSAIDNPARLSAPELMTYCGGCHRPPSSEGEAIDWRDPWNTRHQPIYLSQSACFKDSPEGLTCMACHDPHQPVRRDEPAYYNARCAECHSAEQDPPASVCKPEPGCSSCHMPGVTPQSGLTFHNHWIGVYGEGEPLLPAGVMAPSALRTSATNGSAGP